MQLKTIVIDDEASAREGIINLINKYADDIKVIAEANSIEKGLKVLMANKPDVVFLDIKLSPGTGFDLLEKLPSINFELIFTTAHDNYALKAFKFSALDYLLKPISPTELVASIERVRKRIGSRDQEQPFIQDLSNLKENMNGKFKKITLPTFHGQTVIELNSIIRCEADSNYTKFHLLNKKVIVTSKTLKEYQEMLNGHSFFRIQKSHLVNLHHVKKYHKGRGGQVEMTDGSVLQVSRERKKDLLDKLRYI